MVAVTTYTDLKERKIYNKFLLPCLILSLLSHLYNGTLLDSLVSMTVAFFFFFLAYVMGMTSPGDVKLFAVIGSVVADLTIVTTGIVVYMFVQFGMAIYALFKASVKQGISLKEVLKQDIIGFATKTSSAIQPIYFPGAVLIGGSVWVVQLIHIL